MLLWKEPMAQATGELKKKKKKGEEKYEDRSSLPQVLKMSEVILHLWRRSKGLSSMRLCVGVPFVRSWLIRKSLRQNLSAPPLHLKDSERKGDPLLRHQGINTKLLPRPPLLLPGAWTILSVLSPPSLWSRLCSDSSRPVHIQYIGWPWRRARPRPSAVHVSTSVCVCVHSYMDLFQTCVSCIPLARRLRPLAQVVSIFSPTAPP